MSYMKNAITIRIDEELERRIDDIVRRTGRSRSDIVREALRRQLSVLSFDRVRERIAPFAEASGYLLDEDVFDEVS